MAATLGRLHLALDTPDFSSIQCGEGTTGCPGRFIESKDFRHSSNQVDEGFATYFNRPGMTGIDPNLKPVKSGELTGGIEHEFAPKLSFGVRYVHKCSPQHRGRHFFQGQEIYLIAKRVKPRGAWNQASPTHPPNRSAVDGWSSA